ncbi:hypothetical protein ACUWEX_13830 [Okibacterium fritillariae]|uniref:hypothetical protein n=1 Tax=Okibacterium fritillariae TaxID=123320 RepID=UPI0040556DAB
MNFAVDETWYWLRRLVDLLERGPNPRDDMADLWIPIVAAVGSILVALVSAIIAIRSFQVAKASEEARRLSEQRRERIEQERRIDDALVPVLHLIGRQFPALDEWYRKAEIVERRSLTIPGTWDLDYPPLPDLSELQAACYAVRLHAKSEREQAVSEALSHAMTVLPNSGYQDRRLALQLIMDNIRRWRSAGLLGERSVIESFRGIEESVRPK